MTDTRAPNGATGTLLLDPFDVRISNQETTDGSINSGIFSPTGNESNLNANELAAALQTSNIIVTTVEPAVPALRRATSQSAQVHNLTGTPQPR